MPTPPNNRGKQIRKGANTGRLVKLLAALIPGNKTAAELAEEAGLHYYTALQLVAALHRGRVVHIADWQRDDNRRERAARYKLGPGEDMPKRRPRTDSERTMASRRRRIQRDDEPLQTTGRPLVPNPTLEVWLRPAAAMHQGASA